MLTSVPLTNIKLKRFKFSLFPCHVPLYFVHSLQYFIIYREWLPIWREWTNVKIVILQSSLFSALLEMQQRSMKVTRHCPIRQRENECSHQPLYVRLFFCHLGSYRVVGIRFKPSWIHVSSYLTPLDFDDRRSYLLVLSTQILHKS